MKLPTCNLPTRAAWYKLRDSSGGKPGLAKASLGKSLEAFHAALGKASSSGDLAPLNQAVGALRQTAKAFLEDIKKLKNYSKLESTVSREILGKLDAFAKGMEQMAKG
jgi:hypothetical protein